MNTKTPRTDWAINNGGIKEEQRLYFNAPVAVDYVRADFSRMLETECEKLSNGLKAANVELMSERDRRVIAQEGCVKYDALIRELLTYNLPGDMHEKLMRVAEPSNASS